MRLNSAGNVGIGTNSPGARLHSSLSSSGATSETLRLDNPSDSANAGTKLAYRISGWSFEGGFVSLTRDGSSGGTIMAFGTSANASTTNASERMRLDSSGNLGIGTSSPTSKLHVENAGAAAAAARFTGSSNTFLVLNTTGSAGSVGAFHQYQRSGTTRFNVGLGPISGGDVFEIGNASTAFVTLNASGNLGLGVTSPGDKLEIGGAGAGIILASPNGTRYRITVSDLGVLTVAAV
jgi:hypothetical protein